MLARHIGRAWWPSKCLPSNPWHTGKQHRAPATKYGCLDEACGDRTEVLTNSSASTKRGRSRTVFDLSRADALRIMLPSWQRAGAGFKAIVIHELPGRHVLVSDARARTCSPRFRPIDEEITTFAEADRVMRKVNSIERSKVEQTVEQEQAWREAMEATNRSDLRQRMQSMSPRGRAFAELCMRMNDGYEADQAHAFDPHAYIEVREYDQFQSRSLSGSAKPAGGQRRG